MLVVTDPRCALHDPEHEFLSGEPVPSVPYLESPKRLGLIKDWLEEYNKEHPQDANPAHFQFEERAENVDVESAAKEVHEAGYVDYLRTAYEEWVKEGGSKKGVVAETFPNPRMGVSSRGPQGKDSEKIMNSLAKAGMYSFDLSCTITENTWEAVRASAQVIITAASRLVSLILSPSSTSAQPAQPAVFALARPPGHHAATACRGGYCYLNNCALAVSRLFTQLPPEARGERIGILDIDYHHGNGTQEIFWKRDSVAYASLHAADDYPYYTGAADEVGEGAGEGTNRNFPLPRGTGDEEYCRTLQQAVVWLQSKKVGVLCVSLGVDTFVDDPICDFRLTTPVYRKIGGIIASIRLPTLFILEGGYALEALGANVGGVLVGYEEASRTVPG